MMKELHKNNFYIELLENYPCIPKDTKIEDIKESFQIEVMTSSPSPNFFK